MVMASLKIETIHTWVFAFDSAQTWEFGKISTTKQTEGSRVFKKLHTQHLEKKKKPIYQEINIVNNLVLSYRSKKKKKSRRNNAASTAREMKLV